MNWDQLLKIISDSKNISIAVFVTSTTIVTGHIKNLSYIPPFSYEIYISAFILSILSGVLILIWLAITIQNILSSPIKNIKSMIYAHLLSDTEKLILLEFRDVGSDNIHMRTILEKSSLLTTIKIAEAVTSLESKGMLKVANDRNYFWLTKGSEKIVIKLLNAQHSE